jgi:hypothetical protein
VKPGIYGTTQDPATKSPGLIRFLSDDELFQAKRDILFNIGSIREKLASVSVDNIVSPPITSDTLATSIACLSVLGVVNSQASLFNNIVGLSYLLIL